jgi:hypothetical protein
LLCAAGWVHAQTDGRNRVTVSGGWVGQIYSNVFYRQTAPLVGVSYGYRPLKFLEIESGLSVGFQPGDQSCNRFGCYDPNDRYFWIPLGVRFVSPPLAGRVELSLGGGGLLQRYAVSNPDNPYSISSENGLGGYFVSGAAIAVDHRHRFWLGATPRVLLANPEFRRYRWFTITGDFTFRF